MHLTPSCTCELAPGTQQSKTLISSWRTTIALPVSSQNGRFPGKCAFSMPKAPPHTEVANPGFSQGQVSYLVERDLLLLFNREHLL